MARYLSGLIFVLALIISSGWLFVSRPWSGHEPPGAQEEDSGRSRDPARPPPRDQFAEDRDDVVFDGARAMRSQKEKNKISPGTSAPDGVKKPQELP